MSNPEDYPSGEDIDSAASFVMACAAGFARVEDEVRALEDPQPSHGEERIVFDTDRTVKLVIDAAWRIMRNRQMREERASWVDANERKCVMPIEKDTFNP